MKQDSYVGRVLVFMNGGGVKSVKIAFKSGAFLKRLTALLAEQRNISDAAWKHNEAVINLLSQYGGSENSAICQCGSIMFGRKMALDKIHYYRCEGKVSSCIVMVPENFIDSEFNEQAIFERVDHLFESGYTIIKEGGDYYHVSMLGRVLLGTEEVIISREKEKLELLDRQFNTKKVKRENPTEVKVK